MRIFDGLPARRAFDGMRSPQSTRNVSPTADRLDFSGRRPALRRLGLVASLLASLGLALPATAQPIGPAAPSPGKGKAAPRHQAIDPMKLEQLVQTLECNRDGRPLRIIPKLTPENLTLLAQALQADTPAMPDAASADPTQPAPKKLSGSDPWYLSVVTATYPLETGKAGRAIVNVHTFFTISQLRGLEASDLEGLRKVVAMAATGRATLTPDFFESLPITPQQSIVLSIDEGGGGLVPGLTFRFDENGKLKPVEAFDEHFKYSKLDLFPETLAALPALLDRIVRTTEPVDGRYATLPGKYPKETKPD